jgi:transposase
MEVFRKQAAPKEKRPAGRQPQWTTEYMFMVAQKVVEEGMTFRVAAKTFNISTGSVTSWVKRYRKGTLNAVSKDKEPSDDLKIYRLEDQVKELKQEIGDLYLQNQMLKKALYHSQMKKKENSSVITSENLAQFQKGAK